jgi:DNA-binding NtrC family response regulator
MSDDKKIQLLVVDDDEDIVLMMSDFLEAAESSHLFSVITSKNFEESLSIIDGQKPDVLITDITLPGGSGMLLADSLRRVNPDAFIIIMSGWSKPSDNKDESTPKIDAYLKKPFEFDKFDELITLIAASFNQSAAMSK